MADPRHVIIADFINDDLEPERRILDGCADVVALDAFSEDDLIGRIEHADAVMLYHNLAMTRKSIERLEQCKLIIRCGVGIDNVDGEFARSRGIDVSNIPDYGTEEVADSAIGMMLAMTRGFGFLNSRLRAGEGDWMYSQVAPLHRLRGRVFAIIGLGRIGTAAAIRAKAIGMDVMFFDPYKPDGYGKSLGIRRAGSLDELLECAFVLSVHCPLTGETRGMINAATISQMSPGSYLVNTARGAIVDTSAIPDAIADGRLAGAAIDVLENEPPGDDDSLVVTWRDPDHPAHHRVIINPHSAFYCEEGLMEIRTKAATACRCAIEGQPVRNIVN